MLLKAQTHDERNVILLSFTDRSKFLIPEHVTVGEVIKILKRRLQLNSLQSIFLLVNGQNQPATTTTFAEIYREECDPDGFLYIVCKTLTFLFLDIEKIIFLDRHSKSIVCKRFLGEKTNCKFSIFRFTLHKKSSGRWCQLLRYQLYFF